jgi:hypothetical protein
MLLEMAYLLTDRTNHRGTVTVYLYIRSIKEQQTVNRNVGYEHVLRLIFPYILRKNNFNSLLFLQNILSWLNFIKYSHITDFVLCSLYW